MELYQIRHFISVVETGSFTKAARREAVSQPAISASIAKLEAELEIKLLERRRSSVVATPAGMRLLEAGKTMLYVGNTVKAELKAFTTPKLLRIGILQSLSSQQVSKLLCSFRRDKPLVAIELSDGTCEQLARLLDQGKLDTILTIFERDPSKFGSRILFDEPYVLAVPKSHRFAGRQAVTLADLHNEPFIVRTGCDKFQDASDALDSRGIKIKVVYRTDQDDRAFALVAAGIGVAFTPAHFVVPEVKQVPVSDLGIGRTIGLLWRRETEDEHLEEFIRFAESHSWTPNQGPASALVQLAAAGATAGRLS
jgi:DNA-binding transcriptional LysR family regulator